MSKCPTCGRTHKRSTEQNSRYWLLLHKVSEIVEVDGKKFSADTWHEFIKGFYLGKIETVMPDGEVRVRAVSTTTLDVAEFADYMTKIESWAGRKHGVYLDE